MVEPRTCPLCGAGVRSRYVANKSVRDPGTHISFACGTKWWLARDGHNELDYSSTEQQEIDLTTPPPVRHVPPRWRLYGEQGRQCVERQCSALTAEVERLTAENAKLRETMKHALNYVDDQPCECSGEYGQKKAEVCDGCEMLVKITNALQAAEAAEGENDE